MTITMSQTVISPWLTPVRLASTSNIAGTYYNGPSNNGVGATLTVAASSLTVDSVVAAVGDRILLQTQTNTWEQGIYVVTSIGSTVVLTRAEDMQSIEQLKAGFYVAVGAGSVNAGNFYTLVEPLPQRLGIDAIVFNADPSAGGVSFSGPASTANALAVFSDTAGNLKAASTTTTLGQALAVTGALSSTTSMTAGTTVTATAGAVTSGDSTGGFVGLVKAFPTTATSGFIAMQAAVNGSGNFGTTISNATTQGQAQVLTIPDSGAATANFLLDTGAGNIIAWQEFLGINNVLTFGTGTWTTTRIAQGNYVSRHTAADETSIIAIDVTPMIRAAAAKGFRLDTFDYIYSIGTLALDAHSLTLDRIAYANNVAVSVTSIAGTYTLSTATQANPYVTTCTVTTPAFDVTADSKYVIEITVNNAATSAFDFYGIMLKFSQTIA